MDIAFLLTEQIVQLFLIMLMGYAVVKAGILKSADSKTLSAVLVYLITPCVILHAFEIDYTPLVRDGLLLSFAAAVLMHVLMLFFTALLKRPLRLDSLERASAVYSNAGILVIPLVNALLGEAYVVYSSAFIAVQLVLLWTHCRSMICEEKGFDFKKLLFNLNILAILCGMLLFLFRIRLPHALSGAFSMMSDTIGPVGMLLSGMVIADIPLSSVFLKPRRYLTAFLRLLCYPLILLLCLRLSGAAALLPDGKNILLVVYLAAITPACATVTSMAQLYGKNAALSSTLYVLTTLLSIVTMPLMIALYMRLI